MLSTTQIVQKSKNPEASEYYPLIRTPLLLGEIKENTEIDLEEIAKSALLTNLYRKSTELAIFKNSLKSIFDVSKKISDLIGEGKIIPQLSEQKPHFVNKLSQRLFFKKGQIYYATHRELNAPNSETSITPKLANLHGIFVVVLVRDTANNIFLELRVNGLTRNSGNGHPSLADQQHDSLVCAGEIDISEGIHQISSDKTGEYHDRMKNTLKLTSADQQALMDLYLCGLGNTFYSMKLCANSLTELDDEDYDRAKTIAGINSNDELCMSSSRVLQGLGFGPDSVSRDSSIASTGSDTLVSAVLEKDLPISAAKPTPDDVADPSIKQEDNERLHLLKK